MARYNQQGERCIEADASPDEWSSLLADVEQQIERGGWSDTQPPPTKREEMRRYETITERMRRWFE